VLIRQASEAGQLYGSVTAADIATSVSTASTSVVRRQVQLDKPIKTLGVHAVRVFLHPEVPAMIKVVVARSDEEAEIHLKAGTVEADGDSQESEAEAEAEEASEEFFEDGAGPASLDGDEDAEADAEPEPDKADKPDADPDADKAD
jgi:large subunit ribosomal protein L9